MTCFSRSLRGIPNFGLKFKEKTRKMIDTIILSIPKSKFIMLDMTGRGVSSWDLQARTKAYEKYVKNPSSRDMELGLYFPRLTGYHRKNSELQWDSIVKVEFSAPKLIYRNNLDELTDSDFEKVAETLRDRLKRMGAVVSRKELENAPVTAVHYSKNIELKNGYTAQYVIGELGKINLNKRFDLTRARYMNDGQSLCAYTQTHSLVIYDKVADLVRGKKRSIDREQTLYQLSLFEKLTKANQPREILRFEIRLSQKRKMNSLFKKLGFEENPSFRDVFNSKKSKAVLLHYWDTMLSGNMSLLFAHSPTTKDLLKQILLTDRKMKAKEAIYRAGLMWALREGNGMRGLRSILTKRTNDRTWYRIAADAKEIEAALSRFKPREWYDQVKSALVNPQPFHIEI